MNKKTSNKITNLNFFLTIMVVMIHSSCVSFMNGKNVFGYEFINTICDSAVPVFFCLSAYLFFRNFDMSKLLNKYKKRVRTLLIPYFSWSILLFCYYFLLYKIPWIHNNFNALFDLSVDNIIPNILLANCAPTMWFIRVLMIYVVISPIIYYLMKNKITGIMTILFSFVINIIFNFQYSSMIFWLPVYILGAYLALNHANFMEEIPFIKRNRKMVLIMAVLFLAIFGVIATMVEKTSTIYYIWRILSPISIFILIDYIESFEKEPCSLTKYSFWIFALHIPIAQVIRKALIMLLGTSGFAMFFVFLLTIIITLTLAVLSGKFTKKFLPPIYNILVGGR